MKTTVKYILAAVLAAAAMLPVSAQDMPGQTMMPDSADVYTIEQCYDLVRQNYPLVKRYELLDLTEEYTLKNAYMNYFPQISLQGSASWQTDVLEFPFDLSPYGIEMPTFSKDQYAAVIELSQVLWDGGMIAANRANIRAKADVDMAQQEINMYSLREKVNELYFGILYLDQQIRQVDILMEELEREYARIEGCIANGVASLSDLDLIEVERITQNQSRDRLSSMLDAYLRVLTLMTGVRISDAAQLVMPVPEGSDKEQILNALIASEIRRPELELYKAPRTGTLQGSGTGDRHPARLLDRRRSAPVQPLHPRRLRPSGTQHAGRQFPAFRHRRYPSGVEHQPALQSGLRQEDSELFEGAGQFGARDLPLQHQPPGAGAGGGDTALFQDGRG